MPAGKSTDRAPAAPPVYDLYLMRHGVAEVVPSTPGSGDASRALTPDGKNRMLKAAKGLQNLGVELDWILTSPLKRANQTAEIVASVMGGKVHFETCPDLAPGGSAEALVTHLARHLTRRRVLLVGHEPDISELAARLIGATGSANVAFRKGGCCLIRFKKFPPQSPGELIWWLTPRVMRKLA
jgi:phosphohistidine phosphatase